MHLIGTTKIKVRPEKIFVDVVIVDMIIHI